MITIALKHWGRAQVCFQWLWRFPKNKIKPRRAAACSFVLRQVYMIDYTLHAEKEVEVVWSPHAGVDRADTSSCRVVQEREVPVAVATAVTIMVGYSVMLQRALVLNGVLMLSTKVSGCIVQLRYG